MRKKYRVTMSCDDGTKPVEVVWAESPEHAKKKALARLGPEHVIIDIIAEEETTDEP